jgi:hypothetical protein
MSHYTDLELSFGLRGFLSDTHAFALKYRLRLFETELTMKNELLQLWN